MKWWIKGIIVSVLWVALAIGGACVFYTELIRHGKLTEQQDDAIGRLCGMAAVGGLVAIWLVLAAKHQSQIDSRTSVLLHPSEDIRPMLAEWASANGFVEKQRNGPEIIYQKGVGVLLGPMMVSFRFDNDGVHLDAWVRANSFTRLCAFYMIPAEMGVESGGWRGVLPRKVARTAINKLLTQLGQPVIA